MQTTQQYGFILPFISVSGWWRIFSGTFWTPWVLSVVAIHVQPIMIKICLIMATPSRLLTEMSPLNRNGLHCQNLKQFYRTQIRQLWGQKGVQPKAPNEVAGRCIIEEIQVSRFIIKLCVCNHRNKLILQQVLLWDRISLVTLHFSPFGGFLAVPQIFWVTPVLFHYGGPKQNCTIDQTVKVQSRIWKRGETWKVCCMISG